MKPCTDEPDAGNLHVRICGGGAVEAPWRGLNGHEGGNSGYMPRPSLPREHPPLPGTLNPIGFSSSDAPSAKCSTWRPDKRRPAFKEDT